MSCKVYPNGCIQQHKNLFSIGQSESLYEQSDKETFYFCPFVENVVNLDAGI